MNISSIKYVSYIFFIINSIFASMLLHQEDSITPFSYLYFQIALPAIFIPLIWIKEILKYAVKDGWPLLIFLLSAGVWHLMMHGDVRVVLQLFLFNWVLLWCGALDIRLPTIGYLVIFLGAVLVGVFSYLTTDLNVWGLFPRETGSDYPVWRVSFFPNVVLTGIFSLFAALTVAMNRSGFWLRLFFNLLAFYFLVFSFVRTAFVSLAVFVAAVVWFSHRQTRSWVMFAVPFCLAFGIHLLIIAAPSVLVILQDNSLISRLFLRGQTGLDASDIFAQLSRPWIWQQHVRIFLDSSYMMGAGNFDFQRLVGHAIGGEAKAAGSESLLTRLLATYGLPTIMLFYFMMKSLLRLAKSRDAFGCAVFPIVIVIAMSYGSVLHPTNFLFVLYFQLMIHGRNMFAENSFSNPDQPYRPARFWTYQH